MSDASEPKEKYIDLILFAVFISAILATMAWASINTGARRDAHNMRMAAWNAKIDQARTPEERRVLAYARTRILGCRSKAVTSKRSLGWNGEDVKRKEVAYLIEHEIQCLDALRGEALAMDRSKIDRLENIRLP